MKLAFAVIFTCYVIYNVIHNKERNNYSGIIIKQRKVETKKQYFQRVRRQRRNGSGRWTSTGSRYATWLRMLLLCSGIEANPGPRTTYTCTTCKKAFEGKQRLTNHRAKALTSPIACDACDKTFCHETTYHQHRRTEHVGGGITTQRTPDAVNSTTICPDTGHPSTTEYQKIMEEHWNEIKTQTTEARNWKKINKQLPTGFTYGDLKALLEEVRSGEHSAFKINIGFGSMLYGG